MTTHVNMFSETENIREAYQAFLKNQQGDTKKFQFCGFIAGVFFFAAMLTPDLSKQAFAGLLFFSILGWVQSIIYFIDMSNRNFMLHTIDFIIAREYEQKYKTTPLE